ncbi:putative DDE superfamily endonuclease [Monocercomonoides exilis]|uniref:putative DDE superfamily endonuclease n=1 Tax=Monocercomonoides exilis TaxID=2049356 RepID=UPI003559FCF5|nr:putative DDE superfamily endonuclease [Monocercomonoides exilis]|eukprot:MONOS_12320.1-p1 / transcript=MONOS_12320.1 / gene=MONOS_12320 / organism=Monocercomonoides_exilis_PA203 / gene_product=unspecified product / transcript_product=unspecified product / location=Mono_scaffold00675:25553-26927(-) / protein_length=378 / sequence_SO=supercontig / SO=protein_coding / is_pseudo=false
MSKIEKEIHRIAASSEARLLETPHEKGLHLHLVCGFKKAEIEQANIVSRHFLKRAEKAQKENRVVGKPGRPFLFSKTDEQRSIVRLEVDADKGIFHSMRDIAEMFFSEVKIAPQLLFNLDETSTVFSKSSEDVVVPSSSSVQPIIPEPSLPNSTCIVFLTSADGVRYLTPILIPYSTIPKEYVEATTENEVFIQCSTGHMTTACFLDVFQKAILPSINKKRIAIGLQRNHAALVMDGGTGHFSTEIVKLCKDNLIDLIQLPSHTSHLLQPNDQYIFANMKKCFKKSTECGKTNTASERRKEFISVLKEAIAMASFPSTIKASWRVTGLHPLNPDAVLAQLPEKPPEWAEIASSSNRAPEGAMSGKILLSSDDLSDIGI